MRYVFKFNAPVSALIFFIIVTISVSPISGGGSAGGNFQKV